MRTLFFGISVILFVGTGVLGRYYPDFYYLFLFWIPLFVLGFIDACQRKQAIRRNFPIIGRLRYLFETIRPEINQYFVESNSDGVPFSREQRSIVYQRSKRELDTLPFGTQKNVNELGYEWATHSLSPMHVDSNSLKVLVGGPDCKVPYLASVLNVSAMSYGSLSKNAILALNGGAKIGGFAHNTGEGGLSPYHLAPGGDVVWQIGTGYFGCRNKDGSFSEKLFAERALHPHVKMIEIKLSQGAKPSHGGILPAAKLTEEIAQIRGVSLGEDVISPPAHSAFSNPIELLQFIRRLRDASGGKPVGFKLCIGKRREFIAICKAMLQTGITPDFITVDGGEGGTGAAPLEFSNSIGFPLSDGLIFVRNSLVGFNLKDRIRLIASGRVVTGFDVISRLALGADMCNSARAMMMALGCIQALRCNTNHCPTGVATQNPRLVRGLDVENKTVRIANFHTQTVRSVAEILGAMGLGSLTDVRPWHIMRRTAHAEYKHYGQIYSYLQPGELLQATLPPSFLHSCEAATAETFRSVTPTNAIGLG